MRRKSPPASLPRHQGAVRALRPVTTASAIAIALGSVACSTPTLDVIAADPTTKSAIAPVPAASASTAPYLEPEPHEVEGKIADVKPPPVPSGKKPTK